MPLAERLAQLERNELEQVREQFRTIGAERLVPDLVDEKSAVPVAQIKGVDPVVVLDVLPHDSERDMDR